MGSFWHILTPNKSDKTPRNFCFVDTETKPERIDADTLKHRLIVGVAKYQRAHTANHARRENWTTFATPSSFWLWLTDNMERDRRTVVIAYNMGFDFRMLDGFRELRKLGFRLLFIHTGLSLFLAKFRREEQTILILDACNYFDGRLESWGKMLGLPKKRGNPLRKSGAALAAHCKRDVEILAALWQRWTDFVSDNDLGHFTPTRSAQALSAFRHRFMPQSLYIHANEEAGELERAGYFGGRTECFSIGKPKDGPWWILDVNSMYPAVMATEELPFKFLKLYEDVDVGQLAAGLKRYAIIASVRLDTEEPAFPMRHNSRLVFPVGVFNTVLADAELRYAMRLGVVKACDRCAVYARTILFRDFVRALFAIRRKYEREGNTIFVLLAKKIANSLYGKFGQRNTKWETLGTTSNAKDGLYHVYDSEERRLVAHRVIDGETWAEVGAVDAFHSFPAISACITSAARLRLWRLILRAGRENVHYCDTDSVIVNERGYRALQSRINKRRLGYLKCAETTKRLEIFSPKDYRTDSGRRMKGLPSDATRAGPASWRFWSWEGVAGAIAAGHLDAVYQHRVTKTLARDYTKGTVLPSGRVRPFVMSASGLC